jgi:hypothetical protein
MKSSIIKYLSKKNSAGDSAYHVITLVASQPVSLLVLVNVMQMQPPCVG